MIEIAVFAFKAAFAEKAGHFVFLKQKFHAAGELGHNRIFALNHFGRIKGQTLYADAVLGKIVLRGVEMLGRLQQCFGRNASHIQTGAAERGRITGFVHTGVNIGGAETELGSTNGGNIAAGAGADNHYVKLRHNHPLTLIFVLSLIFV